MIVEVFTATAYDKCMKDLSYETYIVSGITDTENEAWVNDQLKPFGITDEDVHYFVPEGELDDRAYYDTEEFFYLLGDRVCEL